MGESKQLDHGVTDGSAAQEIYRDGKMSLKFCGPKLSLCCTLLSVWAIVQLGLMGLFFYVKSPAFIEDLSIEDSAHHDAKTFLEAMDKSYQTIAINCGIAAGMYAVTLVVSGWQMHLNKS